MEIENKVIAGFFWVIATYFLIQAIRVIATDPNYFFGAVALMLVATLATKLIRKRI